MRGLLEEEYVKRELYDETMELLKQFDEWKPSSKVLKDVKFRLEGIRSKLWTEQYGKGYMHVPLLLQILVSCFDRVHSFAARIIIGLFMDLEFRLGRIILLYLDAVSNITTIINNFLNKSMIRLGRIYPLLFCCTLGHLRQEMHAAAYATHFHGVSVLGHGRMKRHKSN